MIPIDKDRCQAEKPNKVNSFTLGGEKKLIRCDNKPTVIATETKPDRQGIKGSMTMCEECFEVAKNQLSEYYFTIVRI